MSSAPLDGGGRAFRYDRAAMPRAAEAVPDAAMTRSGRSERIADDEIFRILVIDDNPSIQQDFLKIFAASQSRPVRSEAEEILFGSVDTPVAQQKFRFDSALQGRDGLALVQKSLDDQSPYAMAFVDVRMPPGIDGIETTARMWELDRDIQVVICTAYSDYSWKEMVARLGHSDQLVILKKPFDTIEVLQLASALSEKWRMAREVRANFGHLESRVQARTEELAQLATRLKVSEAQYRLLFESNPHPMWVSLTESMRFVMVNRAATESYGYSEEAFLSMTVSDLYTPEDYPDLQRILAAADSSKRTGLRRHRKANGTIIDVEVTTDELLFNGRPARLVLAHDVTERIQADLKLKRLNRVYAVLSGINSLIVRVNSRDELFKKACGVAVEHGRFRMVWIGSIDRATGRMKIAASAGMATPFLGMLAERLSPDVPGFDTTLVAQAIRERKPVVANDLQAAPEVVFKEALAASLCRSVIVLPVCVGKDDDVVLSLYSSDIEFFDRAEIKLLSELAENIAFAVGHIEKVERLQYLAQFDVLTGLANREQLIERAAEHIGQASGRSGMLALYLIDIERFREFNDTLGRVAGDALLKHVAQLLTRSAEAMFKVARVGANQFAILLSHIECAEDAATAVNKTLATIAESPFQSQENLYHITARAGIAIYPNDGTEAGLLFRNAEVALNKAKLSADRYLLYVPSMTETVAGSFELENQLRQALERKEFVLHYQPKVDLRTRKVTGAEALIRWNHPRKGLVPPAQFIPVLEYTGLIHDVGNWALLQAAADHARWQRTGLYAVPIAVNVSVLQLRRSEFVDEIRQVVEAAPAASGLDIEITESMIMEDVKQSIVTLQAIRDLGVKIAIDDFGTGFSSLSYLARLPVSALKIDRSFITEMMESGEGLALVSTIIKLGHSLNLRIVAEGVETEEQLDVLRGLSCDEMQGYLFSEPVPTEIFEAKFLARAVGAPTPAIGAVGATVGAAG